MTTQTLVSFHAHPDDEVLLTGGTLAQAAAMGHRVIIVFATDGAAGLAAEGVVGADGLGARRREEARAAAAVLGGEARFLGYDDSGMDGLAAGDAGFSQLPTDVPARRLAEVLREVKADLLTVYDEGGGYGHPDHIAVHRVGVRAAALAGVPRVLEATVDRRALLRVLRVLHLLHLTPADWDPHRFQRAFTATHELTHCIDVRSHIDQKRQAMAAHATQSTADIGGRTLERFLRLPDFMFRRAFGREWYVERGRPPQAPPLDGLWS